MDYIFISTCFHFLLFIIISFVSYHLLYNLLFAYLYAFFPNIDILYLILLAVANLISQNMLIPTFLNSSASEIKQFVLNTCLVRNLFGKL